MDLKSYVSATGSFLKAEDIKKYPAAGFIITGEGQLVKSEKFGNERLHLPGEFNLEDKTWDCSKTNARAISSKLGEDTKKWIGHQVFFEVYKTKTTDGKLVDALTVREVR